MLKFFSTELFFTFSFFFLSIFCSLKYNGLPVLGCYVFVMVSGYTLDNKMADVKCSEEDVL